MARKIFTILVFTLGLFSFSSIKAQVTFSFSPSNVTPNVGDIVTLNVAVGNFTNILSAQYTVEWDPALFEVAPTPYFIKGSSFPDLENLQSNLISPSCLGVIWNSTVGTGRTLSNGTVMFQLKLKVLASSSNYWAKFSSSCIGVEVYQSVNGVDTEVTSKVVFGNLGNPPGSTSSPLPIATTTHTIQASQSVCVAVTSSSFTEINSANLVMKWDSTVLRFDSLTQLNSTLNLSKTTHFNTNLTVGNGRLYFNWADQGTNVKSLAANDTLFKVCYRGIGAAGTSTTVRTLADSSRAVRISGGNNTQLSISPANGTVSIVNPTSGTLTFSARSVSGNLNDTLCVKVFAKNFDKIAAMQWSMHWDSTKFSFVQAKLTNPTIGTDSLPTAGSTSFGNSSSGTLTFVWLSSDASGRTLSGADSVEFMQICLRAIGGVGTTTPFRFDGIPTRARVFNESAATVAHIFNTGNLTINASSETAILATGAVTNVKCNAGSDGAIALTVSGGNGSTYAYSWTGPNSFTSTSKDLSNLKAGTYNVTITSGSRTLNSSFTVTEPVVMAIGTPSVTNTTCNQSNGSVVVNPTGGTSPYTYSWTGPSGFTATSKDITSRSAGTYNVTVTDSRNCTASASSTIGGSTAVSVPTPTVTNTTCNQSNGSVVINPTGGTSTYTYSWTGPNGFTATSKDITNRSAGTYNVTVTDSQGCTATATASIGASTGVSIPTPTVTNATCNQSNGSVVTNPTGGNSTYTYSWTGPNGFTATSKDITNRSAGTYNVTVSDSQGCTATASATISSSGGATVGNPTLTNVLCFGSSTGAISISPTGGSTPYTFSWSGPNGFTSTQQNIANLAIGNYQVTITDASNCTTTSSVIQITSPLAISISGNVTNASGICNGSVAVTVSGGQSPYTYAWSNNTTSATASNLCPGSVTVTVTDANNCKAQQTFTVGGTTTPQVRLIDSVVTDAGCPGQNKGSITVTFSGGTSPYTVEWLNEAGSVISRQQNVTTPLTGLLNNIQAGKYRVRIVDATNQTYTSGTLTVSESTSNVNVQVASITNETCTGSDGKIDLLVSNGARPYKYKWNDLAGDGPEDRTGLKEGTYAVTVMDANGCEADNKNIGVKKDLCKLETTTSVKTVRCNAGNTGSITVDIFNGEFPYIIRWTNNDSVRVSTKTGSYEIKNLKAGNYTVTITDSRGQQVTKAEAVSEPSAINAVKSIKNDEGCCNGSIVLTVSGGSAPFSYKWNDGNTSRDRFDLCGGAIRSVEITDGNGCILSLRNDTIQRVYVPIAVNAKITDADCGNNLNSGRIELTVTGGAICSTGYDYSWSNGTKGKDLINVPAGRYTVTVTDAATPKQSSIREFVVRTGGNLTANATVVDKTVTIRISGGSPSFRLATLDNSINTVTADTIIVINSLSAGDYTGTITDSKGCSITIQWSIKGCVVRPTSIFGDFNLKCADSQDGSATIISIDKDITPPYRFAWSNGEAGQTAITLKAGSYTVTVSGANGKSCTESVVIKSPNRLLVDIIADTKECTLTASPTGGTTPYKYEWFTAKSDTTRTVTPGRGNFTVKVTDRFGCTTIGTQELTCGEFCLEGAAVLTPNDDGLNDIFEISRCDYTNIRLEIYNRWGQLVYSNDNYTAQWAGFNRDGKSGSELPEGAYFWVLKGTEPTGKTTVKKGTVNLLRQ